MYIYFPKQLFPKLKNKYSVIESIPLIESNKNHPLPLAYIYTTTSSPLLITKHTTRTISL